METMEITTFDRHANMSRETCYQIFKTLQDLELLDIPVQGTINMIWGLLDGYDYTAKILESAELEDIKLKSPQLANQISAICYEVIKYEKL